MKKVIIIIGIAFALIVSGTIGFAASEIRHENDKNIIEKSYDNLVEFVEEVEDNVKTSDIFEKEEVEEDNDDDLGIVTFVEDPEWLEGYDF